MDHHPGDAELNAPFLRIEQPVVGPAETRLRRGACRAAVAAGKDGSRQRHCCDSGDSGD